MGAMNLIVERSGAELELGAGGVLVLRQPDSPARRVGVRALSQVILHGEVKLSTGVLRALAEAGVALTAAPARGLRPACVFNVSSGRLAWLRHAQHLAYADCARRMTLARKAVREKLAGQRQTLSELGSAVDLGLFAARIDSATDIPVLMGVEGAAARAYFGALGEVFPAPWHFVGRNRRPPRDPVNALLSLAYTLALAQCERHALRFGLDGSVGLLHGIAHDRQSLALDLLEAVRPTVDRWVALLCAGTALSPERFTFSAAEGCRLDRDGREAFYRAWFANGVATVERPLRRAVAALILMLRRWQPPREEKGEAYV